MGDFLLPSVHCDGAHVGLTTSSVAKGIGFGVKNLKIGFAIGFMQFDSLQAEFLTGQAVTFPWPFASLLFLFWAETAQTMGHPSLDSSKTK